MTNPMMNRDGPIGSGEGGAESVTVLNLLESNLSLDLGHTKVGAEVAQGVVSEVEGVRDISLLVVG